MTPDTPFFIVLHAGSGKGDTETIEATIRGVLEQASRRYNLARIDHLRQLPKLAERAVQLAQQQGAVVVAGGRRYYQRGGAGGFDQRAAFWSAAAGNL